MRVLISSDWHLNDLSRDAYRHKWQAQLCNLIVKQRIDCVLMLGDITDQKNFHSAELVNSIVDHFYQLGVPTVILRGNHDGTRSDSPFFAFLRRVERVFWVGRPLLASQAERASMPGLRDLLAPLGRVLFLPHTANHKRDWADINFRKLDLDWVFAHNTFDGSLNEQGRALDGIPPNIFPLGLKVVSGDVHVPQTVGAITYVGAPYTIDFGNNFNPRVLLIENGKLRSLPTTGPQKRLVEISTLTDLNKAKYVQAGDIVKVRARLTRATYTRWPEMQDKIGVWAEQVGCTIHQTQAIIEAAQRSENKPQVRATRSDQELLRTYAKQQGIESHTLQAGISLMEQK